MHANSISTINIMFSSMFKIKQVTTVQTNCIILFPKCFEIPSFCIYIYIYIYIYICIQAIGNSSKQFCLYPLFAETFGTCMHLTMVKKNVYHNTFLRNHYSNNVTEMTLSYL